MLHKGLDSRTVQTYLTPSAQDRHPCRSLACTLHHTSWTFAVEGLSVKLAFPSDHEIGALEVFSEPDRFHHDVDSWTQLSAEERDQGRSEATRCPCARNVPNVDPQVTADDVREVRERSVQQLYILRARPF